MRDGFILCRRCSRLIAAISRLSLLLFGIESIIQHTLGLVLLVEQHLEMATRSQCHSAEPSLLLIFLVGYWWFGLEGMIIDQLDLFPRPVLVQPKKVQFIDWFRKLVDDRNGNLGESRQGESKEPLGFALLCAFLGTPRSVLYLGECESKFIDCHGQYEDNVAWTI